MDLKEIEAIMELMQKHDMHEVALEDQEAGRKLNLVRGGGTAGQMVAHGHTPATPVLHSVAGGMVAGDSVAVAPDAGGDGQLKPHQNMIRSPFVGTFYVAPSPGAEPFVRKGSRIKKGDVLCIVEAMKLMNEIESELDGVIVEILVKNEDPVEFDQPIMIVE